MQNERYELTRMFFEDAFAGVPEIEVEFIKDDQWEFAVAQQKVPTTSRVDDWRDYGLNPATFSSQLQKLVIFVNIKNFVASSAKVKDEDFPEFMLYWKTRLAHRLMAEEDMGAGASASSIDARAAQIDLDIGMSPWWTDE